MAVIYSYPLIGELNANDIIAISDASSGRKTKSVTVGQLEAYINIGQATVEQVDDRVVTSASFNANSGVLTLTRNSGEIPDVTANLDGRYALTSSLAAVATSGSYTDLSNQPTIPPAYSNDDVDTHLNTSSASNNQVLSWSGTAYDWVDQSGGGGGTNLGATHTATSVTITSDTGTNGQINAATSQFAGVMTAADKTTLDNLSSGSVTSIIAGTGIGINQSTGDVTITNTGSPTGGYTALTRTFSGNELVNAFSGNVGDEIVLVTVPAGYQAVILGEVIAYVDYNTGTTNYTGSNLALKINSITGANFISLGSTMFTNSSFPFYITNGQTDVNQSIGTANLGENITLISNSVTSRANFTAGDRDFTISFIYRLINLNL